MLATGAGQRQDVEARVLALASRPTHLAWPELQAPPIAALIAQVLLFGAVAGIAGLNGIGLHPTGWIVGGSCAVIANLALAKGLSRYRTDRLGPADWITLARATLAFAIAAVIADTFDRPAPITTLVTLSTLALTLDAADGWVARRTHTAATLGAHFDGEVDAFLILILSIYVAHSTSAWVLTIGAARYAFLIAAWPLPWLRNPLPPRYWRKVVTATQGITLTLTIAKLLTPTLTQAALLIALALLTESFTRDIWWLRRHRHDTLTAAVLDTGLTRAGPMTTPDAPDAGLQSGGGAPEPESGAAPEPGSPRFNARHRIAVALTTLAVLVVWAALVAPDQPSDLSVSGFLRVPLEGLVLVALASMLPVIPRRILAGTVGPLLALGVIFKVLDIGFFDTFNRRFDLLSDSSYARTGIETLRASIGATETNLVVAGVVAGVIVLVILTTFSAFRLTRVAAAHRRWTLRIAAGLGAVWALCWAFGAQVIAHTPIASTLSAGLVVNEVRAVQAGIHDQTVFANQIKHDTFRNTPANQLLTGLRGKDVLLVFVEAYGQYAVQGSSFSPQVDAVLDKGTKTLHSAGFSARSGFLTSATYGGISWLAHSTLQSGVWVNNQRRYNQLMSTNRFTLSDAFKEAGWRTVDNVPSNDYYWAQGTSFYHYDKLYDRRNVGYHGPTFTYASMPDQYTYAALQRLELSKKNRKPLFAEVDTVSSHMPWNRIPEQISWQDVGNGSIYNKIPMDHETGAFWSNPTRVKAAYGRSIVYSLNTLISFVKHANDKKLVMVVLGDHQPLPIVSGHNSNHDVPISIIAHDPTVLKQVGNWGWDPGLRPQPDAPVLPMSAFRNRFFIAFDSKPANP